MPARTLPRIGLLALAVAAAGLLIAAAYKANARPRTLTLDDPPAGKLQPAPDLTGGVAWLNSAGPIGLKDLKGKVVVLDFWTLCCINCIHVMPDLAKLEKKYPNELVVIGVHSPKFDNEKDTKSIRKAVLRYELAHPVVNDAERKIWDSYGVQSWPTIAVVDPEGNLVGTASGEGNYDLLDRVIGKLVEVHKAKGTLKPGPTRFDLARFREAGDTPLFFPGKLLADAATDRLYVSDSTHHRVVVSTLAGKHLATIGSGTPGRQDGPAAQATFDDPQGLALDGGTLYIADRKNHSIRAVDLKSMVVRTVAGTGTQAQDTRQLAEPQPGTKTGLNSPWDLHRVGRTMFVAMAGHHQIWTYDLDTGLTVPYAGDGREDVIDGPLYSPGFRVRSASFAQPSGLTDDGQFLYVADSEVSAVRRVPLAKGNGGVETLVGEGLFKFGDVDGVGRVVRLQHALAVAAVDGKILVADTYNSKLKYLDPKTKECRTLTLKPAPGEPAGPLFDEPAGLSIAAGKAYVADTNAHRIRVVDLRANTVSTLPITGLTPPPLAKEWTPPAKASPPAVEAVKVPAKPVWFDQAVNSLTVTCEPAAAKPGQTVTLRIVLDLKDGFTAYPLTQTDPAAAGQVSVLQFPAPGPVVFVGPTADPADVKVKPEPAAGIKELRYATGRAVWERKFVVNPAQAPGDISIAIPGAKFAVCDPKEGCFPPRPLPAVGVLKVLPGPAVAVEAAYAAEVAAALGGK